MTNVNPLWVPVRFRHKSQTLTWSILQMLSWWEPELEWTLRSRGSNRVKVQFRSRWLRSLQWTLSNRWLSNSPHLLQRSPRSKLAFRVSRLARREMRWWV